MLVFLALAGAGSARAAAVGGGAGMVRLEDVKDMIKIAKAELKLELKSNTDAEVAALREEMRLRGGEVAALREEIATIKNTFLGKFKDELTTINTETIELQKDLSEVKARLRSMDGDISGAQTTPDLTAVTALVTKLMDKHKRNSRSLSARIDALEDTIQTATAEVQAHGNAIVPSRHGRRLSEPVDLKDAALWMQARNAKILFGETGDTSLRRTLFAQELSTDHDFVVKRDMKVEGENWHLTTMIEAKENITLGDVISLCQGKACVGYGLEAVGRKGTNEPGDVGVISLGGVQTISVLYYREWSASSESKPFMRMIKTIDSLTNDYTADPKVGEEKSIGDDAVSELRMVGITDSSFIMCYRRASSSSSDQLAVQGGIRFGEIESIEGNI